ADEVVRHHGAGHLASQKPRREQCALAHPRTTGHHDPAIGVVCDQKLIEPGQQNLAPNEPLVALPLDAVVKSLPGHGPSGNGSRERRPIAAHALSPGNPPSSPQRGSDGSSPRDHAARQWLGVPATIRYMDSWPDNHWG